MGTNVKALLAIAIGKLLVGCITKMVNEIQEPKPSNKNTPAIDPATNLTDNKATEQWDKKRKDLRKFTILVFHAIISFAAGFLT